MPVVVFGYLKACRGYLAIFFWPPYNQIACIFETLEKYLANCTLC